jgi:hypothetical protein
MPLDGISQLINHKRQLAGYSHRRRITMTFSDPDTSFSEKENAEFKAYTVELPLMRCQETTLNHSKSETASADLNRIVKLLSLKAFRAQQNF